MTLRDARLSDAAAIAAIWNPVIRDTTITFTSAEKTLPEIGAFIAGRGENGLPVLVIETAAGVLGYASYAPFRIGPGYARTMEHSILVAPGARGGGIGRRLITALEARACGAGVHSLIGGISGENAAGLAFHAALGYAETARLPEVGWKFGRWLDLVLVQKFI